MERCRIFFFLFLNDKLYEIDGLPHSLFGAEIEESQPLLDRFWYRFKVKGMQCNDPRTCMFLCSKFFITLNLVNVCKIHIQSAYVFCEHFFICHMGNEGVRLVLLYPFSHLMANTSWLYVYHQLSLRKKKKKKNCIKHANFRIGKICKPEGWN